MAGNEIHVESLDKVYVQYGCGLSCPEGWLNFDSSPRMRFESLPLVGNIADAMGKRLFPRRVRYGDIVKGLPVADNSADAVYASHVLEHLPRADMVRALANTYRILKPGGVFRLIVPDLEWRARNYLSAVDVGDAAAADLFVKALHFGRSTRARGPIGMLRSLIGNSAHLWMYDVRLMSKLITESGFVDVRRCAFSDSGDVMFAKVEDPGRFIENGMNEVALHARKPLPSRGAEGG